METSTESYWGDAECPYLRAVVVKPHKASDDSQLNLSKNEIIIILEQDETGWWGGHKEGQEEKTGWFPGSSVRTLSPTPSGQALPDGKVANSALETVPSPARQSYKAISPERAGDGRSHSQNYQALLSEYEHLKRDKAVLEDKFQKVQRKSDDDQKLLQKTTVQMKELEKQLHDTAAKLQAEMKMKTVLQEENARLKEEMRHLQATSAALGSLESQSDQRPKMETPDRRGERSERGEAKPPNWVRTATPSASAEEGEAPPVGTVKQIRDAFERRSTPQRPRERPEREREQREQRSGSLGAGRDAPLPGRFVAVDGDVDFGLSPIRRGSRPNFFPGDAKPIRATT
eukprot:Skav228968  [mRNA]  locus=scaffold671:136349:137380:+ [translate_table: standard]